MVLFIKAVKYFNSSVFESFGKSSICIENFDNVIYLYHTVYVGGSIQIQIVSIDTKGCTGISSILES